MTYVHVLENGAGGRISMSTSASRCLAKVSLMLSVAHWSSQVVLDVRSAACAIRCEGFRLGLTSLATRRHR